MRKSSSLRFLSLRVVVFATIALYAAAAMAADPAPKKAAAPAKAASPAKDAAPAKEAAPAQAKATAPAPAAAKDVLPAFSLKSFDGKTVTNDTLKGKASAFVFWQTACSLCRVEVEDVNQLSQMPAYKGIGIYLVNVDLNAAKVLPSYVESNKISLPILIDPDYSLGPKFGINATPGAAFVDSKGKVVYVSKGYGGDGFKTLKEGLDKIK